MCSFKRVQYTHPATGATCMGVVEKKGPASLRASAESHVLISDAITPSQVKVPIKQVTIIPEGKEKKQVWVPYQDDPVEIGSDVYSLFIYQKLIEAYNREVNLPRDGNLHPGHQFSVPIKSGRAHYVVTSVHGDMCRVEWRGWEPERHTDCEYGWGGLFPITQIRLLARPKIKPAGNKWEDHAEALLNSVTTFLPALDDITFHQSPRLKMVHRRDSRHAFFRANEENAVLAVKWGLSEFRFTILNAEKKMDVQYLLVGNKDVRMCVTIDPWDDTDVTKIVVHKAEGKIATEERQPKDDDWKKAAEDLLAELRLRVKARDPVTNAIIGNQVKGVWSTNKVVTHYDCNEEKLHDHLMKSFTDAKFESAGFRYMTKGREFVVWHTGGDTRIRLYVRWYEKEKTNTQLVISPLMANSVMTVNDKSTAKSKEFYREWKSDATCILRAIQPHVEVYDPVTFEKVTPKKKEIVAEWQGDKVFACYAADEKELDALVAKKSLPLGYQVLVTRFNRFGRQLLVKHTTSSPDFKFFINIYKHHTKLSALCIKLGDDKHDVGATKLLKNVIRNTAWREHARLILQSLFEDFTYVDSKSGVLFPGAKTVHAQDNQFETFYADDTAATFQGLLTVADRPEYDVVSRYIGAHGEEEPKRRQLVIEIGDDLPPLKFTLHPWEINGKKGPLTRVVCTPIV